jgi:hypothetical protein
MNYSILVAVPAVCCFVVQSAFAFGLTESDHDYLVTQNVERGSSIIRKLSPKEQARLHALINDSKTENDPTARTDIIRAALKEFEKNQFWEEMNPGQLWDSPKGKIAR